MKNLEALARATSQKATTRYFVTYKQANDYVLQCERSQCRVWSPLPMFEGGDPTKACLGYTVQSESAPCSLPGDFTIPAGMFA